MTKLLKTITTIAALATKRCIRDRMNVPFVTGNEELDAKFVKEATAAGFVNLKGHRTVGGMRAVSYTHLITHTFFAPSKSVALPRGPTKSSSASP